MQGGLFHEPEIINLQHASLVFWPEAFAGFADDYFNALQALDFQQDYLNFSGKPVAIPRLQAFYHSQQLSYRYSGLNLQGKPFPKVLTEILQQVQQLTACPFNAVLANYYRTGQDSVAFHADDEPELGPNPVIASASFGGGREFIIRDKQSKASFKLLLPHGSLLLMQAPMQRFYEHSIAKCKTAAPRINLTFRQIIL